MANRGNLSATLFPLLLAGFLAGISYWLEVTTRPPASAKDGSNRHDPDYYVANFSVRRFDAGGILQHTFSADLMQHYPDDDSTDVTAPRVVYHRDPATFITSKTATVDGKGEHVRLINAVRIVRAGAPGKPPTTLTTQHLDVWPDTEQARSDVPVLVVQGLSNVTGNTLESNNKAGTHVLDGAVRGIFYRGGGVRSTAPAAPDNVPPAIEPQVRPAAPPAKPQPKPKPKPQTKPKPQSKPKR